MVTQMRDECCFNSTNFDLDRVLRELQDQTTGSDGLTRIGPFGVFPLNSDSPKSESSPEDIQDIGVVARITTPEIDLTLSQFTWADIDGLQTWNTFEAESATALINLRFTPDKDLYNADIPSQWL